MSLIVELLGTRGSLPTPYHPSELQNWIRDLLVAYNRSVFSETQDVDGFWGALPQQTRGGYGGNTSCTLVRTNSTKVIIDGGTGLRHAIPEFMAGGCAKGTGEAHILMTHFHWDHIMGLPFFVPIFIPGNKIHLYAVQEDLEQVIRAVFKKPFFPVAFEMIEKNFVFHKIEPRKPFQIGDLKIAAYQLDHPDPCWGFRIESGGKVYAHCADTEGTRVSREALGPDLPLYQGVDLMYFDGQYTVEELKEKINWGHSSILVGLEIAMREQIKRVVFSHHDPFASDDKISRKSLEAVHHLENELIAAGRAEDLMEVEWGLAIEGMKIDLG